MIRIAIYGSGSESACSLREALNRGAAFEAASFRGSMDVFRCGLSSFDPDVVLLEVTPDVNFAGLREIVLCAQGTRVVLWADNIPTEIAICSIQAGVRGILRKSLPLDLQVKCLERVHAGELWYEKRLADFAPKVCQPELTSVESRMLGLVSRGLKDWEIGEALAISERDVGGLLTRLFQKVGAEDRFELALVGLRHESPACAGTSRFHLPLPLNAAGHIPTDVFESLPVASPVLN